VGEGFFLKQSFRFNYLHLKKKKKLLLLFIYKHEIRMIEAKPLQNNKIKLEKYD